MEVLPTIDALQWIARAGAEILSAEKIPMSQWFLKTKRSAFVYEPLGVIGVISPWNYPWSIPMGEVALALMAGNGVVLKPASLTPLIGERIAQVFERAGVPSGLVRVVHGPGTGAALAESTVGKVFFTGSVETGRSVAEACARRLKGCVLELGGKDPMIVCADADIERAANAAVFWSMQNAGQTCISVERCYVEEPIHDRFVELVGERARALRQGVPGEFGSVDVGSFINPPQIEIVEEHVNDAVKKGARVVSGGHRREGEGTYYEPTVLADVDHTMECMTEETFGPTLPIMKVADADEAVRLANDSPYGLGASVFSRDAARGEAIARRLEAGAANVNDAMINYTVLELPMGGAKTSGIGSRHGAGGIRKYCSQQAIVVTAKLAMKKELFMFPYKSRTSRMLAGAFKLLYGRGKRD
jgi:acyl-CoA reductase-like NAD-dependent aldehyde dehydrogenase